MRRVDSDFFCGSNTLHVQGRRHDSHSVIIRFARMDNVELPVFSNYSSHLHIDVLSVILHTDVLLQHLLSMRRPQDLIFLRSVRDRIIIPFHRSTRQIRTPKLPKLIRRDLRLLQNRLLPQHLILRHVDQCPVFFEHHRFPDRFANRIVFEDPGVAPRLVVAPAIRVQVKGAVVQGGDGREVQREIDTFGTGVGVTAVAAGTEPALIAQGDEVGGVK